MPAAGLELSENALQVLCFRHFLFLWGNYGVKFIKLLMLFDIFSLTSFIDIAC